MTIRKCAPNTITSSKTWMPIPKFVNTNPEYFSFPRVPDVRIDTPFLSIRVPQNMSNVPFLALLYVRVYDLSRIWYFSTNHAQKSFYKKLIIFINVLVGKSHILERLLVLSIFKVCIDNFQYGHPSL